jgi:signal peptidase
MTDWLSLVPLGIVMGFGLLGLSQWIRRKRLLKVDHQLLILGCFYLVVLAVFILFAVLLVGVRIVGIDPYIVLSGSMEPEIGTGALVYVNRLTPEEAGKLEAGDTVTYMVSKNTVVTHKIYEVVGEAYVKNQYGELILDANGNPVVATDDAGYPIVMYTTYGINNKNLDGTQAYDRLHVPVENVVGIYRGFRLGGLGHVALFMQSTWGLILCIGVPVLAVIAYEILRRKKKDKENQSDIDAKQKDIDALKAELEALKAQQTQSQDSSDKQGETKDE